MLRVSAVSVASVCFVSAATNKAICLIALRHAQAAKYLTHLCVVVAVAVCV